MAYTKTQYVDGVTPLNAKNFNKNEGALEQVSKDIDALSSAITQVDSKVDGKANSNHTHSEYATTSALNNKVDKVSGKGLSTNDFTTVEKNKLASLQNVDVTKTYVDTELGKKSDKTNTYTKSEVDNKIAEAQLGGDGGNIDLSGYATKDDLLTKAEKVHAHTEYASKSSEHTHDNKTALDKVTDAKMNSWDSKATGNHNHNSSYSPLGHRHDASEIDNLPSSGGSSTPVIDNLTSTSTTSALSANQGKVLDNKITVLNDNVQSHLNNHPNSNIINQNGGKLLKIWAGTQLEYDSLEIKDEDTVYLIDGVSLPSENVYSVTNNLDNCTNNNATSTIKENSSYTATITPTEGCRISNASVSMGGVDITSTSYNNGNIIIQNVTGNIIIDVIAIIEDGGSIPSDPVYRLASELVLNGSNYVDTGVAIFEQDKDFTIFADFTTDYNANTIALGNSKQNCVFRVKQTVSPWIGVDIAIHKTGNDTITQGRGEMIETLRNGYYLGRISTGVISSSIDRQKYVIKRVASERKMYFYDNQGLIGSYDDSGNVASNLFNTTVIVGGYNDGTTTAIIGTVHNFAIWNYALRDDDIISMLS